MRQGTDSQGRVISTWMFDPDGTLLEGPDGPVSHLICGGVYDWSTGLIYRDGSYYVDPDTGEQHKALDMVSANDPHYDQHLDSPGQPFGFNPNNPYNEDDIHQTANNIAGREVFAVAAGGVQLIRGGLDYAGLNLFSIPDKRGPYRWKKTLSLPAGRQMGQE